MDNSLTLLQTALIDNTECNELSTFATILLCVFSMYMSTIKKVEVKSITEALREALLFRKRTQSSNVNVFI